jgi:hypothetical protein
MKLTGTGKLVATIILAAVIGGGAWYGIKNKKVPAAPAAVEQVVQPTAPTKAETVKEEVSAVEEKAAPVKKTQPKKKVATSHKQSGGHSTTGSSIKQVDESQKALEKLATGGL